MVKYLRTWTLSWTKTTPFPIWHSARGAIYEIIVERTSRGACSEYFKHRIVSRGCLTDIGQVKRGKKKKRRKEEQKKENATKKKKNGQQNGDSRYL